MTVCLSPNGMNVYQGKEPAKHLLVGTTKGVAVLERKSPTEWSHLNLGLEGHHISSLLLEPKHGGIFAGVHNGGLFFSADRGSSWEPRSTGISINHIYTLGCTMEGAEPALYAGTEPVGLFRSRDYGKTWEEIREASRLPGQEKWSFPMPPHKAHVKTLAFDPRKSSAILVGVEQGGLYGTADSGFSWNELDSYAQADDYVYKDIHQIVRRPNHPDELYMVSGMGLYRSADNGKTWLHLTGRDFRIGYPDKLLFSPIDDRTIIMCGSLGNPGTWIKSHTAQPTILISRDLGESWSPLTNGLPDGMKPNIEALSMQVTGHGFCLFAGTTDGEVYAGMDDAQNWSHIFGGLAPVSKSSHFRLLIPGGFAGRPPAAPPGLGNR